MTRLRLRDLLFALALLAVVAYYRRRERSIVESLTRSRAWAPDAGSPDATAPTAGVDPNADSVPDGAALARVASLLGTAPEAVPERVEALDRKVRDLTTETEKARSAWASRWWEARETAPPAADGPHVTLVTLEGGVLADAEAIAKSQPDAEGVVIAVAPDDGTLAVAAGAGLEVRADELAREIATEAGGGAGGDERLATGGGEGEQLCSAAERVRDRLAEEGFAT